MPVEVVETGEVASFEAAFARWRERSCIQERLDAIAIAAAGPVAGERVRITNLDWTLDARTIERTCNVERCLLVNDVTAIAWALPSLSGADVRELCVPDAGESGAHDNRESNAGKPGTAITTDDDGTDSTRRHASGCKKRRSGDSTRRHSGVATATPRPGRSGTSPACPADDAPDPCPADPTAEQARAVIAPGTGLGVSGLVPTATGDFAAVEGEGGHRTLAAQDAREWRIVTALAERFGHASAERALSGPGIEAIWGALASFEGVRCDRSPSAAEIARDAFARTDPIAEETIAAFTGFLAAVAGDLALTLGARGGVYIAGGIVPGWGERFDAARFLDRFRAKGRFRDYLRAIPVYVVTHPYPGLAGVERLLTGRTGGSF